MSKAIWKQDARCGPRAASDLQPRELAQGLAIELLAGLGARIRRRSCRVRSPRSSSTTRPRPGSTAVTRGTGRP